MLILSVTITKVQANFARISDTQFLLDLLPLNDVNHIAVFLTGEVPFPEGMGGGGKQFSSTLVSTLL